MASVHIANFGSAEHKARYLPDIIAGRTITAIAVTEPDAGSDVKGIRTNARREGSSFVINGAKMFISNGVYADLYCVAAKTAPEARASQSISMLLVEKGTPGLKISRALDKHGWRSSDTAALAFEDCRVPPDHPPGREGGGHYAMQRNCTNVLLV